MEITRETVDYISELAQLEPDDAECERMRGELQQLITYMNILNRIDTAGTEPMSHPFPVRNVLRDDEVMPSLPRSALLANAPESDGEFFLVPMAVERG